MKILSGILFLIVGLFNMFVGVIIYSSTSFKIDNFLNKIISNSPNILPTVIFLVGLLYFIIGLAMVITKNKAAAKPTQNR